MGRETEKVAKCNALLTHLEGDDHPGGGDPLVSAGGALERKNRERNDFHAKTVTIFLIQ